MLNDGREVKVIYCIEILKNSDEGFLSPRTKFQEPHVQAMNTLEHEVPET
jgi:hypothetical protein